MKAALSPLILVVALTVAVAGLLYALTSWERHLGEQDARLDAEVSQTLHAARQWQARFQGAQVASERLDRATQAQRAAVRAIQTRADSLDRRVAALGDSLSRAGLAPADSLRLLVGLAEEQRAELLQLRPALALAVEAADSLAKDRDRWKLLAQHAAQVEIPGLQKTLADVNRARQCHVLGFITCPSRATTLVLGAVLGGGAVIAVRR